MTDLEINQTIHEAIGKCWHEFDIPKSYKCKCGIYFDAARNEGLLPNPSYTTSWADYGQALEWAKGEIWWEKFAYTWEGEDCPHCELSFDSMTFREDLLNPLTGSTAIAEFIKEHPEYFKEA